MQIRTDKILVYYSVVPTFIRVAIPVENLAERLVAAYICSAAVVFKADNQIMGFVQKPAVHRLVPAIHLHLLLLEIHLLLLKLHLLALELLTLVFEFLLALLLFEFPLLALLLFIFPLLTFPDLPVNELFLGSNLLLPLIAIHSITSYSSSAHLRAPATTPLRFNYLSRYAKRVVHTLGFPHSNVIEAFRVAATPDFAHLRP